MAAALLAGMLAAVAPVARAAEVRLDQVGWTPDETKIAYLLAKRPAPGVRFVVVNEGGHVVLRGKAGRSRGPWNRRYRAVHPLNLSPLKARGTYRVRVGGRVSPHFRIGNWADLFAPKLADTVTFFQAQRDGADVIEGELHRRPAHLNDAHASVFDWPRYENADSDVILGRSLEAIGGAVDLEGGWWDAGDFIKFAHTTAYAEALLLAAHRELGAAAPPSLRAETDFGLRWLDKVWDEDSGTLYIQVGIGSGNRAGTFVGDHDLWRLPQKDDRLGGRANRYLRSRPAFRAAAPGEPLPPNLAGRMAAAFALAAQTDAAGDPARARAELETAAGLFAAAKTSRVKASDVVTALPHAFYPESSWRDDLELGGAELALAAQALGDSRATEWLAASGRWAGAYLRHEAGGDTLNLYDTSALAHADLVRAMRAAPPGTAPGVDETRLLRDLRAQLGRGRVRARHDPFRAGAIYDDFDAAAHTFGLVVTARLYGRLSGRERYDAFATAQRDWALGANAWGVSLMIGAGSNFPRCPQHVVANLSGRLDGRRPILRGAVVNGPNDASLFEGGLGEFFEEGRTCPAKGGDRYRRFSARGSRYIDDVRSWQTDEPAADFTAAATLAFALLR